MVEFIDMPSIPYWGLVTETTANCCKLEQANGTALTSTRPRTTSLSGKCNWPPNVPSLRWVYLGWIINPVPIVRASDRTQVPKPPAPRSCHCYGSQLSGCKHQKVNDGILGDLINQPLTEWKVAIDGGPRLGDTVNNGIHSGGVKNPTIWVEQERKIFGKSSIKDSEPQSFLSIASYYFNPRIWHSSVLPQNLTAPQSVIWCAPPLPAKPQHHMARNTVLGAWDARPYNCMLAVLLPEWEAGTGS